MRDKNRIPLVLEEIERIWSRHPDIRFMQLINNLTWKYASDMSVDRDLFYLEDDKFFEWLEKEI